MPYKDKQKLYEAQKRYRQRKVQIFTEISEKLDAIKVTTASNNFELRMHESAYKLLCDACNRQLPFSQQGKTTLRIDKYMGLPIVVDNSFPLEIAIIELPEEVETE